MKQGWFERIAIQKNARHIKIIKVKIASKTHGISFCNNLKNKWYESKWICGYGAKRKTRKIFL